jgi:hypothetical protein
MKLVNNEWSVFTKVTINPVFQIQGDDRWASRSRFIVHVCPSAIKQTTPLTHIPLALVTPHTLLQVGDGFRQGECFSLSKIESLIAPYNRRDSATDVVL